MKFNRGERGKVYNFIAILVCVFCIFSLCITFLINVNTNKGIIPLIFIFLILYTLLYNFYIISNNKNNVLYENKWYIRIMFVIFLLLNIFLFVLSYIVLWL